MTFSIWNSIRPSGFLAAGLCALFAAMPASAHEARYYYGVNARNTYLNGFPGMRRDGAGETPQAVDVTGASAYAIDFIGGKVFAGAEVHPIDPYDTNYQTSASAQAYMTYNVWIDGPDPDAFVPVRFVGSGAVSVNSNHGLGDVTLRLASIGDESIRRQWYARGSLGIGAVDGIFQIVASLQADEVFMMQPKKTYSVELIAGAGVAASANNARAEAVLDPTFTILDGFDTAYRVMGVPGMPSGPGGAVPEPSSWAMMIAGFGAVGTAMRRRVRLVPRRVQRL